MTAYQQLLSSVRNDGNDIWRQTARVVNEAVTSLPSDGSVSTNFVSSTKLYYSKYCMNYRQAYAYKVSMKQEWVSYLDLILPSRYLINVYTNVSKSSKKIYPISETFLVPYTSDKVCSGLSTSREKKSLFVPSCSKLLLFLFKTSSHNHSKINRRYKIACKWKNEAVNKLDYQTFFTMGWQWIVWG